MKKTCSMCGKPFEFEMGPNGEVPDGVYHSRFFIEVGTGEEYWECPKCFRGSASSPSSKLKGTK